MNITTYPRRVLGSGMKSGLRVKFRMNSSLLNNCESSLQGFKISLDMPVDIPRFSKQFYTIPFGHEISMVVKPDMIYASKDIKAYTPESRQCFFNHEGKLKYFKYYSQSNCELECKSNFVYKKCGCTKFSMPRDESMNVCDYSQNQCVQVALANYTTLELEKKVTEKQLKRELKHGTIDKNVKRYKEIKKRLKELEADSCNCLQSCASIKYEVEIDRIQYKEKEDG
jgi:amiloride-sensitive sodium channel